MQQTLDSNTFLRQFGTQMRQFSAQYLNIQHSADHVRRRDFSVQVQQLNPKGLSMGFVGGQRKRT